jgi:hypothetical protein
MITITFGEKKNAVFNCPLMIYEEAFLFLYTYFDIVQGAPLTFPLHKILA